MTAATILLLFLCTHHLVLCQNLDATMKSYNIHVTTNDEGTMLKYISPETDVKSTMKDIPKVDVRDAKLLTALITKKNADIVLKHPKMSIDGKFPEYSYAIPKKNKTTFYDIHKIVHQPGFVPGSAKSVVFSKPESIKHTKLQTRKKTPQVKQKNSEQDQTKSCTEEGEACKEVVTSDEDDSEIEEETEEIDVQSADGPHDETLTSNKDEGKDVAFPPKVPEIPIELGSSSLKNEGKMKDGSTISKQKQKPCQENCSDTYSETDEDISESKNPPQDIPIELGVMGNQRNNNNNERITYIDHKTPKQFILLDNDVQRERRSIKLLNHKTKKSNAPRLKKRSSLISKRWRKYGNSVKRSDIAEDKELLQTLENFNSHLRTDDRKYRHAVKSKPFQGYMNHLAKDVRNVMGQAKRVLTNTGQVVHALKRVLNGASALSSFTNNAANFAKYFEVEPNNATIDYLEERAIVAVLEAQKAASVAKEAANIARIASAKAKDAERRMEVASHSDQPLDDTVMHYVNIASEQADRAIKAAKYAAGQKARTENDVRYVDKALSKLTKTLHSKETKEIEEKTNKIFEEAKATDSLPTTTLLGTDTTDSSSESAENDADSRSKSKLEALDDSGTVRDQTPLPADTVGTAIKNPFETINKEAYSKYFLFKQKQLEDQLKRQHTHQETPTKKSVMLKHYLQKRTKRKHIISDRNVNTAAIPTKNEEILGVKSKISSLSSRLEQVIKSIKNNTHKETDMSENKVRASERRQLKSKPVHLVSGEYTGFKKDKIVSKANEEKNRERKDDIERERSTKIAAADSIEQEVNDIYKRGDTMGKNEEIIPDAEESGSGENEVKPGSGVSKIVKGPITVTVNVRHHVKPAPKSVEDPFSFKKLDNEDIIGALKNAEDPFGFKEADEVDSSYHHLSGHAKENNLLDPFKFKQDTNEGTIYDRAHIPKPNDDKKPILKKEWD